VLLAYAALYHVGAGPSTLLVSQGVLASAAAVPLFFAARRLTGSGAAGLALSAAFLLNPHLHAAIQFDFHPETHAFLLLFASLYFLSANRPKAAVAVALPLLLLKEDMALVAFGFACIAWTRGFRREGAMLGTASAAWAVLIVLVVMPLIRGGGSDLTERYSYLTSNTGTLHLLPTATGRAISHLWASTVPAVAEMLGSGGFIGLLSPLAMLLVLPNTLVSGLADHPQQSHLEFHYSVPTLALVWIAVCLGLERVARLQRRGGLLQYALPGLSLALVVTAGLSFLSSSLYAPGRASPGLDAAQRAALREALELIPAGASVRAQSSILPHLSQRPDVFEFPDQRHGDYVIVDSRLPISGQSYEAGFESALSGLGANGYQLIYEQGSVQVFRFAP
jgi:uncharacterized membrane protein